MERPVAFWGELIQSLRVERHITQRELAVSAKVNRSTLRRIEAGSTPGDMDTVERVLGFLGYELEALDRNFIDDHRKMQAELKQKRLDFQMLDDSNAKRSILLIAASLTHI